MNAGRAALVGLLFLVAGCSGPGIRLPGGVADEALWAAQREAALAVTHFELSGRAAVQSNAEGFTASVDWRESPTDWTMRIQGPFSQGRLDLTGEPGLVRLAMGGRRWRSADAESLLRAVVGWTLPVSGLRYWIRGLPDPALPLDALRLDAAGLPTDLTQGPWRISVLRWKDGSPRLPEKLFLKSDRLELRIVVQSWRVPGA